MILKKEEQDNILVTASDFDNKDLQVNKDKNITMGLKEGEKDKSTVDSITEGLNLCNIEDGVSNIELTEQLKTLSLSDREHSPVKLEPQEDDENGSNENEKDEKTDNDDVKEVTKYDALVKLDAPSFDDNEDCAENEAQPDGELETRGPTNGVPSVNYNTMYRNVMPDHMVMNLPPNFPCYNNYQPNMMAGACGQNQKRMMEQEDIYFECPKYVKPPVMGNNYTQINTNYMPMNNLNEPAASRALPQTKKVVLQTQLSGSTMIQSGDLVPDANLQLCQGFPDDFLDDNLFTKELETDFYAGFNYIPPKEYQPVQQIEDYKNKRWSSDDVASDGYGSDPGSQSSPAPSPYSMMDASGASPSGTSFSPPPSNLSADSGVNSPMADDVRSPRQVGMSPRTVRSPYVGLSHMTPPYTMSPPHPQSPPQQPTYCSPAHEMTEYNYPEPLQLQQNFEVTPQSNPAEDNYTSSYVTEHLALLSEALEVAGNDLLTCAKSKVHSNCAPADHLVNQFKENIPNIIEEPTSKFTFEAPKPSVDQSKQNNITLHPLATVSPQFPVLNPNATKMYQPNGVSVPQQQPTGKIPIPPLNRKPQQSQPVVVTSRNLIFITTPPTKPRFTPILPKTETPDKPVGEVTPIVNNPVTQNKPPTPPVAPQNKKTNGTTLLNLARRVVAGMSTTDLQKKDDDGDTYLHVAVCQADCYMVQALLERLVREKLTDMIDIQNTMGQTPLYLAVSTNHPEMVTLLIEHNADINPFAECILPSGIREKSAAIHCASSKGETYLDTLKALLHASHISCCLNQVNSDGHTALHCAIRSHGKLDADGTRLNSIPIIQSLIHAGADPNMQVQQSGKTSLMYALESRDIDLIEKTFQLVDPSKLGSYLKTQAFDGSTCLKIAESLKQSLSPVDQQRLNNCLKPVR
ncbi:uncharacterized protein LOC131948250 isoform X2 [Physella acuta]|uniref:uncharacterized protein LOC131948250 isoform X2 n=1 Tax=Physella acuta TaxID=109671 RepID=UPI0027DD0A62|nr:uncharacterized protein LOC131948250 isoform X2 [Physella acuta]